LRNLFSAIVRTARSFVSARTAGQYRFSGRPSLPTTNSVSKNRFALSGAMLRVK
jgi:hypothetical protein